MISTWISRASAAFLALGGVALLFGSDEILPRLVPTFPREAAWLGQLLAAAWLAVGALNWLNRSTMMGGIYGRPLVLANASLYFISSMVLLRLVIGAEVPSGLWLVVVPIVLFALIYALLLFRGPIERDFEAHRKSV